jgi:hypothetical protein
MMQSCLKLAICCTLATVSYDLALHAAPPPSPSPTMAARLRWMQFRMSSGRVTVTSSYPGTNMTARSTEAARSERVAIHLISGFRGSPFSVGNLHYEQTTPDGKLDITVHDGRRLTILRTLTDEQYALEFRQVPGQPLVLRIDDDQGSRQLYGDSFWHLYLDDPTLVGQHLVPLLELLHPAWQLIAEGGRVEAALFDHVNDNRHADRQRWAGLVALLASPRFVEREAAERELYRAGQVVVPYLEHLDPRQLDAEQASRVRSVITSLSANYQDSVERLAVWLAGDPRVWVSLLAREDADKRRVAAGQLSELLGETVAFAPRADAATRRAQIDVLRARFARSDGQIDEAPSEDPEDN